jgi:hypothetical protein
MFEQTKGNKMQQWRSNPTLYAPIDFWREKKKKNYGPPLCVLLLLLFFFFPETLTKPSRYRVTSFPYNSGTSQNDFWIKETDKRAKKVTKRGQKLYK